MGKYIVENKNGNFTAVLYSPGWGAGWSTWGVPNMAFDHRLVKYLLPSSYDFDFIDAWTNVDVSEFAMASDFENYFKKYYPNCYAGGIRNLHIVFIPVGTIFRITEYDGSEDIETFNIDAYYTA